MPLYEHVFLARQDISAQQAEALVDTFQTVIKDAGGMIGKSEYWGLKSLSYKIKKNRKAHFALFNIDASAEAVAEMERQMRISSDVIRFMTLRVDAHDAEPSPMMKRGDRDERRGGRRDRDRGPRDGDDGGGPRGERPRRARAEAASDTADTGKDNDDDASKTGGGKDEQ